MTNELCQNYASALYGMLSPSEREEAVVALSSVVKDFKEEPAFEKLLSSYSVSAEEKRRILEDVYGKEFAKLPHFIPFLKVVSDHHRLRLLPDIYLAYRSLVHEANGVKEGIAYSAVRLDEKELRSIEEGIGKKIGCKVSLTNIVDHRLLGGVKVAVDGKVFDGSLANKLAGLHRTLHGGIPS